MLDTNIKENTTNKNIEKMLKEIKKYYRVAHITEIQEEGAFRFYEYMYQVFNDDFKFAMLLNDNKTIEVYNGAGDMIDVVIVGEELAFV